MFFKFYLVILHFISLRLVSLHFISLRLVSLHFISLRLVSLHFISLRLVPLHFISLRSMAFFCEFIDTIDHEEGEHPTIEEYNEILNRIRNSPYDELKGDVYSNTDPLFAISEHYVKNHIYSKEGIDMLLEIYKEFSKRGIKVNGCGIEDVTLLHDAVLLGKHSLPLIEFLVEKGVDLNVRACGEDTALDLAIESGNYNIAYVLVEKGAKCSEKNNSILFPIKVPSED